ncbi:hypothetical protein ACIBP6_37260 [Nonomuraea terrae]|uniref:hypothetical protein n=1 Tax=Nonomuraea terrae TaxID=2530383 RepID=UPI0037A9B532
MADHDRDGGSRGEEEAPRDPAPTRRLHQPGVDPEPRGLKYGEGADRGYAYIPPTTPTPDPVPPSAFRDFLRRRKTQVVGVGVLGLVAGGLLGGITVSAFTGLTERRGFDVYLVPGQHPLAPPGDRCHVTENSAVCFEPPPPIAPNDEGPTWTG